VQIKKEFEKKRKRKRDDDNTESDDEGIECHDRNEVIILEELDIVLKRDVEIIEEIAIKFAHIITANSDIVSEYSVNYLFCFLTNRVFFFFNQHTHKIGL